MSDRVLQVCDLCGGVDDHPRHVNQAPGSAPGAEVFRKALENGADDRLLADLQDTNASVHHLDCGADTGCDVCSESEARTGGKRGPELIQELDRLNSEEN